MVHPREEPRWTTRPMPRPVCPRDEPRYIHPTEDGERKAGELSIQLGAAGSVPEDNRTYPAS